MENKGFKIAAIVALCVAVAGLSVAYAALSQTLKINSTAKTGSLDASWNVRLDTTNAECKVVGTQKSDKTNAGSITVEPSGLTATVENVVLGAPGDKVQCTFTAKNTGDMDATLASVTYEGATPEGAISAVTGTEGDTKVADEGLVKSDVTYTLSTDEEGASKVQLTPNTTLAKTSGTQQYYITFEYKDTAVNMPASPVTIGPISHTFTYNQK